MKKFELDKGYEEIDIAGDIYKVDLSDNKRKEWMREGTKITRKADEIEKTIDDMPDENMESALDEVKEMTKSLTHKILGDGSFDTIYKKANGSLYSVMDVVMDVIDYLNEKDREKLKKKKAKYLKRKKR